MTDIEMLPLPEPWGWARANNGMIEVSHGPECPHNRAGGYATPWGAMYGGDVLQDHARANVAHATAAKDAEIEALRAEVEFRASVISTHAADTREYQRRIGKAEARAERLAEALRDVMGWVSTDNYFTDEPMQALARARAALNRTAEQEGE